MSKFIIPTHKEIGDYAANIGYDKLDVDAFYDHFEERDWKPKGYSQQMKSWKACVRNWCRKPWNYKYKSLPKKEPEKPITPLTVEQKVNIRKVADLKCAIGKGVPRARLTYQQTQIRKAELRKQIEAMRK